MTYCRNFDDGDGGGKDDDDDVKFTKLLGVGLEPWAVFDLEDTSLTYVNDKNKK